ncbi:uncharacterized protein PG986_011382 [Apiospora aurea]|uniref:Uncharacterized protein n=1 Tax=Apiospora aurea TaxID=335848 RepID=A0ABR1Q4Z0_9PEZI
MASVRNYVTPYLPSFIKSTNSETPGLFANYYTIHHLLYLTSLLAAFALGAALGHLYWRRLRAGARRAHARAHRWATARRYEAVALWDGVGARLEGAVAGWKNGMSGRGANYNAQRPGSIGGATGTGHQRVVVLETAGTSTATEEEGRGQGSGTQGGGGGRKNHRMFRQYGKGR